MSVQSRTTDDLDRLLRHRAGPLVQGGHASAVVAVAVREGRESVVALGRTAWRGGHPTDPETAFELGSLTKTFTGLLLAEMATRGEVTLDDPVAAYLPCQAVPRDPAARRITLRDLATYTSGLRRIPWAVTGEMMRSGLANPYARYQEADLYRTTARMRTRRPPGSTVRYSTLGYGLLGQALANAAGTDYPALIQERICGPLAMTGTGTAPHREPAIGHRRRTPVPPWLFGALAGAGALRSTGTDMLRYLRAQLAPEATPLASALRLTHQAQAGPQTPAHHLAWFHYRAGGLTLLWLAGGTSGFTTFLGFSPASGAGVVLMANVRASLRQPVLHAARKAFYDVALR